MKKIEFIALRQVELEVPGMEGLRQVPINRPEDISFIAEPILGNLDREMLLVLGLNTKNKVNMVSVCSIGTVNSSVSSVREVFKALLLSNCLSFIVVHNHPSGDTQPSRNDIQFTRTLKEAGDIMQMKLLDSIIYGDNIRSLCREMEGWELL